MRGRAQPGLLQGDMMRHLNRVLMVVGVVLCASWAGDAMAAAPGKDRVVYKKKTVIDLTGVMIEGQLTKPEGAYVVNRRVSQFSALIKLRKNFLPELTASADQL